MERVEVANLAEIDWRRVNERLVHEVYRDWDNSGEGYFALFFLAKLAEKWKEYVSLN